MNTLRKVVLINRTRIDSSVWNKAKSLARDMCVITKAQVTRDEYIERAISMFNKFVEDNMHDERVRGKIFKKE